VYCLEFAGEDDAFAAREARTAAAGLERVGPGLAVAGSLDAGRARTLAFTRRCSRLLGRTDAGVASARALLAAAPLGDRGPEPGSDTVRVRARDVRGTAGVSTAEAERELGAVLVERGFEVDLDAPDHELRALFAGGSDDADADADGDGAGVCLLGWLTVAPERTFADRAPGERPFFQPGSMDPGLARALVNLAGARPGARLLDPMCGTGGLLIEAALVGADPVGLDAQHKMVRGSRRNLAWAGCEAGLVRGDAARPPFPEGAFDAVVFDAPYGRQSKVVGRDLVADALRAAADLAPRGVLVADRSYREAALAAGWTVEETFRRRVHRSLTRHVHVLR
jgi:tRNA (guanine10-N2)-dimethyltransferase